MRVTGSADGCEQAARQLQRAAAEVSRSAETLQRVEVADWTGTAAQGWERLASRHVVALREVARTLAASSRAVGEHADVLRELQQRARRLTAEAADAGLVLDERGGIPPVPLPDSGSPDLLREALHRREVRRRLLVAVAELRRQEDVAHDRLQLELRRSLETPAWGPDCEWGVDIDWLPTAADLPAFAVSGSQLAAQIQRSLPAVLRHAGASAGLGFGVGFMVDRHAGLDVDDAITKGLVVTGAGVVVAAAIVAAPVTAGGAVVVGAAAGASFLAGRVFDKFGHRLPWVQHTSERGKSRAPHGRHTGPATRHPYQPPVPGGRTPRHVVHRVPAPAPGPAARRP